MMDHTKYRTNKLLIKNKPEIIRNSEDKFVLQVGENKKGRLQTKEYLKKSLEDKPLISIITVVFNGEKYLEETIKSVINQTYENIEYIIIDGGSTDGTLDIIKKYEENIDYWVSEKDNGIYAAMNKGINVAKGQIIGIVNADDFIYPDTLKNISIVFEDPQVMFTYGSIDLAYENGRIFASAMSIGIASFKYRLFKHMPFLHPTMFVKSEIYAQIGGFNTAYKLSADYDFSLRLVENNFLGKELDFVTGIFRIGGQSGGLKTYKENQIIALAHDVNPFLVYLNTTILIIKKWLRDFFAGGIN